MFALIVLVVSWLLLVVFGWCYAYGVGLLIAVVIKIWLCFDGF